jgi:hypothetical protein
LAVPAVGFFLKLRPAPPIEELPKGKLSLLEEGGPQPALFPFHA